MVAEELGTSEVERDIEVEIDFEIVMRDIERAKRNSRRR